MKYPEVIESLTTVKTGMEVEAKVDEFKEVLKCYPEVLIFREVRTELLGLVQDLVDGTADNLEVLFKESHDVEVLFKEIKEETHYRATLEVYIEELMEAGINTGTEINLWMLLKQELTSLLTKNEAIYLEVIAEYTAKAIELALSQYHGETVNYYLYQDVTGYIAGNSDSDFNNYGEKAKYGNELVVTQAEKVGWIKKFLLTRPNLLKYSAMGRALYMQKDEDYFAIEDYESYSEEAYEEYRPQFRERMMVIFED